MAENFGFVKAWANLQLLLDEGAPIRLLQPSSLLIRKHDHLT